MGNAFHMVSPPVREPFQKLRSHDRLGGKYILIRRIALGGMGQIWIARNEMTDAEVALKVLRADIDKRIQVEPRFRHEARLGAMLCHRNIVRIFDLVEEPDGSLVLVMELLRGETLRRHLKKKGPLSAEEAIAILLPVLSALEHAHEMGVVHRDIKPANIFLAVDPDGHVVPKLLDFGIAKVPQAGGGVQTLDGRVLGTPRYMSPEQIRSEANIDGRSDIFSMGAVMMEMLTGQSPFVAETPSASLASVLETLLDPDPRIDPRLWLVLQRALAKRPYERYAHCAELAQALREAIGVSDHALLANLRRSKPPPRISTTLSIHRPDEPVRKGIVTPENGMRIPGDSVDEDYDSEEDGSDYAIDVISQGSESSSSESISGYRSSQPSVRTRQLGIAEIASTVDENGKEQHHLRISRGRLIACGVAAVAILTLVFCGGLYFREAHDRVTNRNAAAATPPPPPPTAAAPSVVPAAAAAGGVVPATSSSSDTAEPAAGDAPAMSNGSGRRDPPSTRPMRSPRPAKKDVARTPGF
ncbi:serine/threonine protein kinase [Pendulispora brunnea]|uniref:Serine/threonine protein kinase n=1 Tax=Pendulispora brunnea TaxID=2905690 RepID=A0ABZ2K8D0_9BACT